MKSQEWRQAAITLPRTTGENEGKVERRVVDAVEEETAIEVKDIVGAIDREQFGAYMDMMQSPDDGEPLFQTAKYVFTNLDLWRASWKKKISSEGSPSKSSIGLGRSTYQPRVKARESC